MLGFPACFVLGIGAVFYFCQRFFVLQIILRSRVFFLQAIFGLLLQAGGAEADSSERRVALLIGNGGYSHVPQLLNPANDAADLAVSLRRIGFEVTVATDLDYREMRLAVRDFSEKAEDADIALLYYAGHGIEIENTNYLIPVNAELRRAADVEFEALRLDALLSAMAAPKGLKIVLIDACRDNPFRVSMRQSGATRSIGQGLARIEPTGVVVGYAAKGGTYALDGDQRNSPYAAALIEHLETPGLELGKLFRKVRDTVFETTSQQQEPFVYGSLPGHDIFLVDPLPVAVPATVNPTLPVAKPEQPSRLDDQELSRDFATTSERQSPTAWRSFLQKHEDHEGHPLMQLAEERMAALLLDRDIERGYSIGEPWLRTAVRSGEQISLTREDRQLIQRSLNMMGFDTGGVDGQFGPKSRRAIGRARTRAGLAPGTNVDLALLKILPNALLLRDLQSSKARSYLPEDLPEGLEPRLRKALLALKGRKLVFEYFEGHLYIVVSTPWTGTSWKFTSELAQKAGGYLVAIGSRAENDFIVDLFSQDEIFIHKDWQGHQMGPNIGLHQVDFSNEPAGGWEWANGDRVTYNGWSPGNPDNHRNQQHIARFWLKSQMDRPGAKVRFWDDGTGGYGTGFVIEIE